MSEYRLLPLAGKHGKGKFAKVDPEDFEDLSSFRWYVKPRSAVIRMGRRELDENPKRHISMQLHLLGDPGGLEFDHIDGDMLNNCRSNLRLVTRTENLRNRRGWGKNKYKGVQRRGDKWQLNVKVIYDTEEEAALAFNKVVTLLYGEHARLNDVPDK